MVNGIGFNNLTGPDDAEFDSYRQDRFIVSGGTPWKQDLDFGNPAPSIRVNSSPEIGATLTVGVTTPSLFTFQGLDILAVNPSELGITGFRNFELVFAFGTPVSASSSFETIRNPYATAEIDNVVLVFVGDSPLFFFEGSVDNIVVTPASEPSGLTLLASGLAALGLFFYRYRIKLL